MYLYLYFGGSVSQGVVTSFQWGHFADTIVTPAYYNILYSDLLIVRQAGIFMYTQDSRVSINEMI